MLSTAEAVHLTLVLTPQGEPRMASASDLNRPHLLPPSDVNPRRDTPLDFPDRDFGQLSSSDYKVLGFMSGLEVHQQLATAKKLFCRCPSGVYVNHFDAEVLRHMRPTLSELGEYDGCALMEFKTHKEIVYQLERGTVCTYEIDDNPPFEINPEAVEIAVEIAQLFNLSLIQELHVMRKQYLDGSIPAGFQRTAMIGLSGAIPFVDRDLGIDRLLHIRQLSLEEDSCREVSDVGHRITFRTDRLGTPLTEVVTEPELLTPFELQAAARLVARTTRASGLVRRGPGAARQDVNVSVAGGRRIEIKGVSHQKGLPLLVHNEAYRQLNLLRIREELRRRGVRAEWFTPPDKDGAVEESENVLNATSILSGCDFTPLRNCLDAGESTIAVRLRGFQGLLLHRTQPGVTFANEFADRVQVIACLTSRPFLIHSDIEGYGLDHAHWLQLEKSLRADKDDALIVVWGPRRDLATAVREIFLRAKDALIGVPAETRQAYPDGTNGFERILPGVDRMYPDTDTPPVPIDDGLVERIRLHLPETPWQKEERCQSLGLPHDLIRRTMDAPWCKLFEHLEYPKGEIARRIAYALEKRLPHWWRETGVTDLPSLERLRPWAAALIAGHVRPEACETILDRLLREIDRDAESIITEYQNSDEDEHSLENLLDSLRRDAPFLRTPVGDPALRWAMGRLMPSFLGKRSPQELQHLAEIALGIGGAQ